MEQWSVLNPWNVTWTSDPTSIECIRVKRFFYSSTYTVDSNVSFNQLYFILCGTGYSRLNYLRWLDWIFLGGYLSSLSINYVGMSKDMEKSYHNCIIKMKISYELGFIAIGVAMATQWRHYVFHLSLCFSVPGVFGRNRLREYVPAIIASIMAKFKEILWERFRNILKCSFKNHQSSEIAC